VEQTVGDVRNVEDGTAAGDGTLAARTLQADVAKRECEPHGRSFTPAGVGRARNGRTLKGREAYERMNPVYESESGDGIR